MGRQAIAAAKSDKAKVTPKKNAATGTAHGRGAELVRQELRKRILDLRLRPGVALEEQVLSLEFGLSRTPIREALLQLAAEGLVEVSPKRGARVAPLDLADAPELLEALELYQRASNRWAALRRTEADLEAISNASEMFIAAARDKDESLMAQTNYQFHAAISSACGNRYVTDGFASVELKAARLGRMAFDSGRIVGDLKTYYDLVIKQHQDLLKAIQEQDAEEADQLARMHIALFRARLQAFLGSSNAGDIDFTGRISTAAST